MIKGLKLFATVLVTAFVAALGWLFYLSAKFLNAPTQPVPDAGRTVGWNSHGTIHFITERESQIFNLTFNVAIILFFCFAGVVALQQHYKK